MFQGLLIGARSGLTAGRSYIHVLGFGRVCYGWRGHLSRLEPLDSFRNGHAGWLMPNPFTCFALEHQGSPFGPLRLRVRRRNIWRPNLAQCSLLLAQLPLSLALEIIEHLPSLPLYFDVLPMRGTPSIYKMLTNSRDQRGRESGLGCVRTGNISILILAVIARSRHRLPVQVPDRAVLQGVSNLRMRLLHAAPAFGLDERDEFSKPNPVNSPLRSEPFWNIGHRASSLGAVRKVVAAAAGAVPAFGPSA